MKIGIIGTGYVGLVTGACFAQFGINVVGVDCDESKIERLRKGEIPIYEPGLEDLVHNQMKQGRLSFSMNLQEAVEGSDAVFLAVGTPSKTGENEGEANLEYVYQAVRDIAPYIKDYTVIVTKSTVPVGTAREIEEIALEYISKDEFDICSNPEFLREGAAIGDFMRPDRVVIGVDSDKASDIMQRLYRPLYLNETPVVLTTPETAEIIKYASNAFLATKITFINEIANLCEKAGGNVQDVARSMGLDGRISPKFLHAGPGYGGSCFPKDTRALASIGNKYNAPQSVVESVVESNLARPKEMTAKIIKACAGSVKGKTLGILGLSFKPNTDDMREAPSLSIIPELQKNGAKIKAYDPVAMENAKKTLSNITWTQDPYEAADNTDALVILTEWNEFRALDLERLEKIMDHKILIDLRNIYKLPDMQERGFCYISVGRPDIHPKKTAKLKQVIS